MKALLKKKLDISCKKSTFLSVKRQEGGGISALEWVQLKYHQRICAVCKTWEDQSKKIDEFMVKSIENPPEVMGSDTMSESKKEELRKLLS